MHEAVLYQNCGSKKVVCTACKHRCAIADGHAGRCGVRYNENGVLYLLVYGKAAACNRDPIEKKPLFHFLPGTEAYSLGTVGCNFHCSFCQNWDIAMVSQDLRAQYLKTGVSEKLKCDIPLMGYDLSPESIVEECIIDRIPTVAYTYNEPSIFAEYAYDTAKLAHAKGIKNVFVSNGYDSDEELDLMGNCLDAMNIDIKSFSDSFYRDICGARLQNVLDTIVEAHRRRIWIEITTLVIPGKNDSDEELRDIAQFIAGIDRNIPWHVTAFYPCYKMLDVAPTSPITLYRAYERGKEAGLYYVYVGNIYDEKHSTTYCPTCERELIVRNGISAVCQGGFDHGACRACNTVIPGVWS